MNSIICEPYTVKKILDQNPAIARTAPHFTVIAGFLYEGYVSIFLLEHNPSPGNKSIILMETYPSFRNPAITVKCAAVRAIAGFWSNVHIKFP